MKLKLLLISIIFSVGIHAQEAPLQFNELPASAREFINQHFTSDFHHAIKTVINKNITYDVFLDDNTEIEFSDTGRWRVVDGKNKAVPHSFIQKQILDYVKIHHEKETIVTVARTDLNYKIKLSTGLDLIFDKVGVFVKTN